MSDPTDNMYHKPWCLLVTDGGPCNCVSKTDEAWPITDNQDWRHWKARAEKAEMWSSIHQERFDLTVLRAEKAEAHYEDLIEAQRVSEADIVVGNEENAELLARAEKAEAQRDDWKAMHRHAQMTIAVLNGDLKGQRARAEKAEADLAELEEIDEVCRAETKRADYWKAEAEKARAALKEQG